MPKLDPPDDRDYHVKRPNEKLFLDCCNEFWWVMTYVAKGIWRKEMPYAMDMLNHPVRDMLNCMMSWHIGTKTDFSVSVGKSCKYFQRYLDPQMWDSCAKNLPSGKLPKLMGQRLRNVYPVSKRRRMGCRLLRIFLSGK